MHGVPADLDLTFLQGATLEQVCIGAYQFWFHFDPVGTIAVEGEWELRDAAGNLMDRFIDQNVTDRGPFEIHRLLGRQVVATEVAAPTSIALRFDNGLELRIFDSSPQYESFSIQPGNIYI